MKLNADELVALVKRVFNPGPDDRLLTILTDCPDDAVPDRPEWKARRQMAADWALALAGAGDPLGLETRLYLYRNVRHNNADLPDRFFLHAGGPVPESAGELEGLSPASQDAVLGSSHLILAPTEFSATAPLKLGAVKHGFRAATMPGFSDAMVAALRLDYVEINRRVGVLTGLLDRAHEARITFQVADFETCDLVLDLRNRTAHASGGLFPEPRMVGNLPSGEAYIVPYEGEQAGRPSLSEGRLPVQFEDGIVIYDIRENRAVSVSGVGPGPRAAAEQAYLAGEAAYGNLTELGLGVLADFGLKPTGEILLDEKLGLHIAFGRSDHFGGIVGPADFTAPDQVVHIDRVFLPEVQPAVSVVSVDLANAEGRVLPLMRDHRYVIDFSSPPDF